jgi:hypothetical protein
MIYLAIFLGLVAWGALVLSRREATKYDDKVSGRSWEVTADYPCGDLLGWLNSEVPNGERPNVKGYALILRRYDIILLVALGGALACGSIAAATGMQWSSGAKSTLLLLPLAFVVADFTEDMLLLRAFAKKAKTVTPEEVRRLQRITGIKLVAVKLAVAQLLAVLVLWGASHF